MAILNGSADYEALITADNTIDNDYEVTMNASVDAGGANEASIAIRYVDDNNFYWMGIGCWGHEVSISKIVNGVPTEIVGAGSSADITPEASYVLKASVLGNTLQFFVNGIKVLETTDSSIMSGGFGIRTYGTSIHVTDIFASSPTPICPAGQHWDGTQCVDNGNEAVVAGIVLIAIGAALVLS